MVEGQYPADRATKETLLVISNAEHTSVVNRSNKGQKSPPMEKLHALVSHQLQEEISNTNQGKNEDFMFQEDNEEAYYNEQAT